MARQPRLHLSGGFYHVMLRGSGGQEIFFGAADGRRFLELLAEGVARFGHRVHGFCLMPDHVHLVLQAGAAPLGRAMQNLAFRYTRSVNLRKRRAGPLFGGRYKALLVDPERYLPELVRYVHLNPLRAGLADRPEAWRWSGARAYLGVEELPWLTTDRVLGRFGRDLAAARAGYRAFVQDGLGEDRRPEFHDGVAAPGVIGEDDFLARVPDLAETLARPPELETIVDGVCARYGLAPDDLAMPGRGRRASEVRGVIAILARDSGAAPLTALARAWRRDLSTLSHVMRGVEERQAADPALAKRIAEARDAIKRI